MYSKLESIANRGASTEGARGYASQYVCSDMKLESDGGTDDSSSGPLAKLAEMKRLVGIAVANGTPIRVAYKDVRRRMRIEARRQKEVDEGAEPEVVLDSFLDQVKVEQHPQSELVKKELTPAAKAAKHRRARDKKLRETLCWWIANDKVCPDSDRCNFRHAAAEEKEQTVSGTGASWPSPATEQSDSGTCVLSPSPSLRQKHPKGSTCDSWNNSWDKHQYRDKWTDAGKRDGTTTIMTNWTDTWSKREAGDDWRTSHWETSGWCSRHWETRGWNKVDECSHNREGQQWLNHSFFETVNVDQLIDSLCKGDNDVSTSRGLKSTQASHSPTQLHKVESSTFVRFERPKRLFHKFGVKRRVIPGDNHAVGIGGKAKLLGEGGGALWQGRRQWNSEVYRS